MTATSVNDDQPTAVSGSPGQEKRHLQLLLIALLATALMIGPISLLRLFDPAGPWFFLTPIVFLVSLEGTLTTNWLNRKERRVNPLTYRLTEFVLLLVILRLLAWLLSGQLPDLDTIYEYFIDPLTFFDLTFLLLVFVVSLVWAFAWNMAGIFSRLALKPDEIAHFSADRKPHLLAEHDPYPATNRGEMLQSYIKAWAVGGLILAIFAMLTTFDLSDVGDREINPAGLRTLGRLGLSPTMLIALILYFMGGLWLASQGRLAVLRARWLRDGFNTDANVHKKWQRNSVFLLVAIALITAFLPIGSTLAIARILEIIVQIAYFIITLIFTLVSALIYFLVRILPFQTTESSAPPPDFTEMTSPPNLSDSTIQLPSIIFSSLFWFVAIAVIALSAIFFLRGRGISLRITVIRQVWQHFTTWVQTIFRGISRGAATVAKTVRSRLEVPLSATEQLIPSWRYVRLNSLSPRDQVRYFYLALARRAGQQGLERQSSETPLEYSSELKTNWSEAEADLETLTTAFLDARYSDRAIHAEELPAIKRIFRRLRGVIRSKPLEID